jgi:predicted TIM-barrel fold metal-dependent hydrolase
VTDSLISAAAHGPYQPSEGNPPPHTSPHKPALVLPPDSCDSHCHVFGPGTVFPYDKDRTFTPVDVPREKVAALHEYLGLARAVVIQSACHGFDHSALLDALAHGGGRLRGVGLIHERTSPEEIARLHTAGVRGFRCNFLPHLRRAPSEAEIATLAGSVAGLGWHTEIHVQGEGVVEHERFIASLPTQVVVDHLGRVDIRLGLDQPAVRSLLRLLDTGRVYVKVSGIDRVSRLGPPYADAVELAALVVRHAPERVLWGTDFPHPNIAGDAPDDGLLVDLLAEIAPSPAQRDLLLVANPAAIFDFDHP